MRQKLTLRQHSEKLIFCTSSSCSFKIALKLQLEISMSPKVIRDQEWFLFDEDFCMKADEFCDIFEKTQKINCSEQVRLNIYQDQTKPKCSVQTALYRHTQLPAQPVAHTETWNSSPRFGGSFQTRSSRWARFPAGSARRSSPWLQRRRMSRASMKTQQGAGERLADGKRNT